MSIFSTHVLPSSYYNALPSLKDSIDVTKTYAKDLQDIRALMHNHKVTNLVSIQVIRRYVQLHEGEVMLCNKQSNSQFKEIRRMEAIAPSSNTTFVGVTHYVTDIGLLQAYEYANGPVSDLTHHTPFLQAFCYMIKARGLQGKFGLRLWGGDEPDAFLPLLDSQIPLQLNVIQPPESEAMAWRKHDFGASSKSPEPNAPLVGRLVCRCKAARKFGDETWGGENWDKRCDHGDCPVKLVPVGDYEQKLDPEVQMLVKSSFEQA